MIMAIAGGGLVVVLAAVFLIMPMLKGDGRQAAEAAARQTWRAHMDPVCPAPTISEAPLPAVTKGTTLAGATRLQFAERADDLGKLGRHIACAMQNKQERLCASAARAEFFDHVRKYFSLRTDWQTKIATAAGLTAANIDKQVAQIMSTAQSKQSGIRLTDQERPVVDEFLALSQGDAVLLRGFSALIEDGYLPVADVNRATGTVPSSFAPLSKVQAARSSCS